MIMSLEEALNRNSDAVEKQNELLSKMLATAAAKTGATTTKATADDAAGDDADKKTSTKRTSKKADAKKDGADVEEAFNDLKAALQNWLGEFKANEADPETEARKTLLSETFKKLGVGKLPEIAEDREKIDKLSNWLETKAKPVDKGHGEGRLTAVPSDDDGAGSEDDDDELGV
jgi:thioredoxin-like negative regulator of GroEL